jgi:chitodextrinase
MKKNFLRVAFLSVFWAGMSVVAVSAASFNVGDSINTADKINIRSCASISCAKLGTQTAGMTGTVTGGPATADGHTWWNINYNSGADGWSSGTYLQKSVTNTAAGSAPVQSMITPVFTRQLDIGSTGSDVSALQKYLASYGNVYPAKLVTGYYGQLTADAVSSYQRAIGIPVAGRVGPLTLQTLNKEVGSGSGTTGTTSSGAANTTTTQTQTNTNTQTTPTNSAGTTQTAQTNTTGTTQTTSQTGTTNTAGTTQTATTKTYTPPVSLKITPTVVSQNRVDLSWNAIPNANGYTVSRSGIQIGTANGTSYSDTTVSPGSYVYYVSANGAGSGTSLASSAVYVFVDGPIPGPDTAAPTSPLNLTAKAISSVQIDLAWTAATDNSDFVGYKIFRDGNKIGTRVSTSFSDLDSTLLPTREYAYTVAAFDAMDNTGPLSNTALATPLDEYPPSTPEWGTATAVSGTQVRLSWNASSDNVGVTGYNVYRRGSKIATVTGTSYLDTGLTASTTYTYAIAAFDKAGNTSDQSSDISVKTP